MITQTKKTQKSLILEDIRKLSNDSDWFKEQFKQLENFFYNPFEIWKNSSDNFKGGFNLEKIRSFDEMINLISLYYSELLDNEKLSEKMISMFGFDSERIKADCCYYPCSYSVKKIIEKLKTSTSENEKDGLSFDLLKQIRISPSIVPGDFDFVDFANKVNLDNLFEIQSQRWFKSPEIVIKVYYDVYEKKLHFGSLSSEAEYKTPSLLFLGKLKVSITQSGTKTPLLNSFLSNKKDKVLSRMEKEVRKMMENFYTEFLGKKVSISDIISGDSISPFIPEEDVESFVKNKVEELKVFYKSCMNKEKEKIFELIKSELGISD